ncbi:MAG: Inosose dehydratase [Proteobacteria bacterium]|nr:MAG: Inosose dehydratase [Pseudomonadota bacterium]
MPELGGDTPIETCLSESSLVGFTGIELAGKFPRNPRIIKFLLSKHKLTLPGGWYGSRLREKSVEEEWLSMQDQIRLLQDLNSSVFIFGDVSGSIQGEVNTALSNRPQLNHNEWKEYCQKISEISKRLDDVGLPMSYHQHMGTIIQTEIEVEKFLEANPSFKLQPIETVEASIQMPEGQKDFLRLNPFEHGTDGFFVACLVKDL